MRRIFSSDGQLIASNGGSGDSTIRLWRSGTGSCVATIPEPVSDSWLPGLAFHPLRRTLATVGSDPGTPMGGAGPLVHIWELDSDVLLAQKGSHRKFVHPNVAKPVVISGRTGDDARHYQEKSVKAALEEAQR